MTTANIPRNSLLEWLDHDADARTPEDRLGSEERNRLETALAADESLHRERRRTEHLHALLREESAEATLQVDEGFTRRVMENLPRAAWETAAARSGAKAWRLPLAALLVFTLGAAFLFAGATDGVVVGTGLALVDFLQATALAGAGLLGATWRGVGLGLEQLFQGSPSALVAFALLVVGIDLLFVGLLRRRRAATESSHSDDPTHTDADHS